MTSIPPLQVRCDVLWQEMRRALRDSAWPEAEGLLRRYAQLASPVSLEVWDTLAYALLMQGDYGGCLRVLEPHGLDPARSFWLQHKLGDAHRGLNQLPQAEACYRQSLADGSDSPLTIRNLLQVLDRQEPQRALQELRAWQQADSPPSPAAWEGARQAAVLVPGQDLAELLWQLGQADASCRRRLLECACYGLDRARVEALLASAQATAAGLSAWEQGLAQRLQALGLRVATSGPAAGAPRR